MMRFDKEAKLWDEKPRRIELGKKVSEYVKKYVNSSIKLLDFGCGTGLVSLNLCGKVDIIGIDLSCEMVNIYNKKVNSLKCKAQALCKDVNSLDMKFDIIVANMVFHHIENINEMLGILATKLNTNGRIIISDLIVEDGSFHDKGNDDVFHFGFEKNDFIHNSFEIVDFQNIYTIKKDKTFDVYVWNLEKLV